ncbi:hypothetical protein Plhal710r2_c033g0121991 [Plasmopara halstedii]
MRPSYFQSNLEEDRRQHLNTSTALVNAQQPEVVLRSTDHCVSHFRSDANFSGRLATVLEQLLQTVVGATLVTLEVFTALPCAHATHLNIMNWSYWGCCLNKPLMSSQIGHLEKKVSETVTPASTQT